MELQKHHGELSERLAQAKTIELESRRTASNLSDEIEMLQRKYTRDTMELEMDKARLEREARDLKEDLRTCDDDLRREKETIVALKVYLREVVDGGV